MSLTATFEPDRVSAAPGETAALTLQLENHSDEERVVKLRASGGLAAQTVLQTQTIFLDPNEHFEVPVIIDADAGLLPGIHSCIIELDHAGETIDAAATVEILEAAGYTARLEPAESRSASAGRHKVAIENAGNTAINVEVDVTASEDVVAELAAPGVSIDPGQTAKIELRIAPRLRFWSGAELEHPFSVGVTASNGESSTLEGTYTQGPRVRPWLIPALAGMLGSLILGTLAWFLLLRPSVEDIAREEAAELDDIQSAEIQTQVEQMQAAAAEAAELPLGEPVDRRLTVTAGPAAARTASLVFDENGSGRVLSVTDIIFQNPTGAVGTVELLRDDDILQSSNMANFRDLDFHLVAPYRIESRSELSLRVACETPGPGTNECEVAATIIGFVDSSS